MRAQPSADDVRGFSTQAAECRVGDRRVFVVNAHAPPLSEGEQRLLSKSLRRVDSAAVQAFVTRCEIGLAQIEADWLRGRDERVAAALATATVMASWGWDESATLHIVVDDETLPIRTTYDHGWTASVDVAARTRPAQPSPAPRLALSAGLVETLRTVQRGQVPDEVSRLHDVVILTLGFGDAFYLGFDGHVLVWRYMENQPPRRARDLGEVATALVIGAYRLQMKSLLELLPPRPTGVPPCATCAGMRWQLLHPLMPKITVVCRACSGLGWTPSGRAGAARYELPDEATLGRYMHLLRRVLVEGRARAGTTDHALAQLLDAVENLPDLLLRWPDMDEAIVKHDLERLEADHPEWRGRFTSPLAEGPPDDWQLRPRRRAPPT